MRLKVQGLRGALYGRENPRMHFPTPLSPLFFLRNYGELHNKSVIEEMKARENLIIVSLLESFWKFDIWNFCSIQYITLCGVVLYFITYIYNIFSVKFPLIKTLKISILSNKRGYVSN
jgi:hypothetical protein